MHYDPSKDGDFRKAGATGGGYVLGKGVTTKATLTPGTRGRVDVVVDGDPKYRASTTRKALELLVQDRGQPDGSLIVEQAMEVPVGCGFGASAAAAISGVYAAAAVMGISAPKSELAYYAHVAEIVQQTGLGTVSVTFEGTGAGAITKPGAPGVSKFLNVDVPRDARIVTASLGPFRKRDALSKPITVKRINELGDRSLRRLVREPSLDRLGAEGEQFSEGLGLMSQEVSGLAKAARDAGAKHASQNMIGHAVHALASRSAAERVALALKRSPTHPRVEVFEVGSVGAHAFAAP